MPVLATQGDRIRAARTAKGITQAELAAAAKVVDKTVSKWENNHHDPEEAQLDLIAKKLGVEKKWIRYGDGPVDSPEPTRVSEATPPSLPVRIRAWIENFLVELDDAKVSEREIDLARRALQSPDVYTFYKGGEPSEYSEKEVLEGLEGIALAITRELKRRGYKLKVK